MSRRWRRRRGPGGEGGCAFHGGEVRGDTSWAGTSIYRQRQSQPCSLLLQHQTSTMLHLPFSSPSRSAEEPSEQRVSRLSSLCRFKASPLCGRWVESRYQNLKSQRGRIARSVRCIRQPPEVKSSSMPGRQRGRREMLRPDVEAVRLLSSGRISGRLQLHHSQLFAAAAAASTSEKTIHVASSHLSACQPSPHVQASQQHEK